MVGRWSADHLPTTFLRCSLFTITELLKPTISSHLFGMLFVECHSSVYTMFFSPSGPLFPRPTAQIEVFNSVLTCCFPVSFQSDSMPILASFLRKNQRALKLSTLTTLNVLVTNYGECKPLQ